MDDDKEKKKPEKEEIKPEDIGDEGYMKKVLDALVDINTNITTLSSAIDNLKNSKDVPEDDSDDDSKEDKKEDDEKKEEYDDGIDHEKQLREIADDLNLGN